MNNPSEIVSYNPKKNGGCAVAIGYDMDMPGDLAYLYDRNIGWLSKPNPKSVTDYCHGHLNEDVVNYIRLLTKTAEDFDARLQFFLQGNTLEDPVDLWIDIVKREHAVDSHMYYHNSLLSEPLDSIKEQLKKTKRLLEEKLGTVNLGLRGPGGYPRGLEGREDVQRTILATGIKWVSSEFTCGPFCGQISVLSREWVNIIASHQPFYYETGLLEMPFSGHQDRSFFDVDMGGSPRPIEEWIAYLKQCIDLAYSRNLFLCLTVHPSTSFKHDPEAKYLQEILVYCRQKLDIVLCTYRDIYRWLASAESESK